MAESRPSVNTKTTSLIDEFEGFYGRDADKKAITDMLMLDDDNGSNPGVIPIVGMGGVGKTTLALHVYNDKAVATEEQFKIRAWVCVSDQFDVTKVTEKIVKKVTGTACPYDDLDQLQHKLKDALNGKKFLLVLDDVWSEEYKKWRQFLTPLRYGAKGSKLIITTRSKEVASKVQTVPTHNLRELEYEDCWKLFATHVCIDVNSAANPPDLQEIGKKIVRKCGGLPLAVKALGGVLRWETKAEKWKEVLKSEIWEVQNANILPALAISYIHLPSHLKRCFAYCAIFPQDYELEKEKLVALWMSEGFLIQRQGNQSQEEIGDIYFDDFVSRSFFQQKGDFFVMHDLVHGLARFVSGEFCSKLEGGTSLKIGEKTRHLSYEITKQDVPKEFQSVHEILLRSFVLAQQSWIYCDLMGNPSRCFYKKVIGRLLPTQKLLRVLSLSRCHDIRELPNSIGNLKHMRHLDLSYTSIKLLPKAVTALLNLEILILQGCFGLVELPADMARLFNLCQLDLRGTIKLKGMPPEIGKLKKLSKLSDFVVGGNGGSSIQELGYLHCLRGQLLVRRLQNVKVAGDASEANLKDKNNLKVLELKWEGYANYSRQAEEVLERLQPHTQIECIEIVCYGGTKFPNWVGDVSFSKLKQLRLKQCNNCFCLPPLGQLASLQELSIDGGYNEVLEAIGAEFYGMCKPGEKRFSSLKTLEFRGMKNWREWGSFSGAFPVIEELKLCDCPNLMSVPNHLLSLKRLEICDCRELLSVPSHLPSLKRLEISDWPELLSVPSHLPSLQRLEISSRPELLSVPSHLLSIPSHLPSLKQLKISGWPKLLSIPTHLPSLKRLSISCIGSWREWGSFNGAFPVLEELELRRCPNLMSVPTHLPRLKYLFIEGCPELYFENLLISTCATLETIDIRRSAKVKYILLETFPNLKNLDIWYCSNLESLSLTATSSDHLFSPSLTSLTIWGCFKLVSLPRGGLDAPNLKSMHIYDCYNLQWMPQGMHSLLSSLEELELRNCLELMYVPNLPPSLKRLRISGCDKVYFENLLIPTCATLETIDIRGSKRVKCIPVENFHNLKELEIWNCSYLESLVGSAAATTTTRTSDPLFFPSLSSLSIWYCSKLVSFPMGGLHAPNLKKMDLSYCRNLKSLPHGVHSLLSSLEDLVLRNCPKLFSVPTQLPSLKGLWIRDCGELDLENLLIFACATLETIHIRGSEKVKCISVETFPNLKELEIWNCSNLESLVWSEETTTTSTSDPLFSPSLSSLCIRDCSKLVSFPRGGLHAPNLKTMKIQECSNLMSLPQGMHSLLPSLENLRISCCPEIESFPEGGLPSELQSLEISECKKLVAGRMQWGLKSLPSLSKFTIRGGLDEDAESSSQRRHFWAPLSRLLGSSITIRGGSCEDVESSFPEETLLPSSLESLEICRFAKMKSLSYKGLRHLSSLQSLKIFYCKNLESLPEEGLPSFLSSLVIWGCPLLEKRCQRERGKDWPKIKHIPHLSIF